MAGTMKVFLISLVSAASPIFPRDPRQSELTWFLLSPRPGGTAAARREQLKRRGAGAARAQLSAPGPPPAFLHAGMWRSPASSSSGPLSPRAHAAAPRGPKAGPGGLGPRCPGEPLRRGPRASGAAGRAPNRSRPGRGPSRRRDVKTPGSGFQAPRGPPRPADGTMRAGSDAGRPPAGSPHPGAVPTARSRSPSDVAAAAVRPQLPHRRKDARPRMRRHHHGRRRLVGQGGAGTRGHVGAHPAGAVLAPGRVRASGGGGGAERCPAVRGCLAGSGGEETTRKRRAVVADRGACPPFFVAGREGLRCCGSERGSAWPSGARCRGGDGTAASPGPICGALREGERGGGKRRWAARAGTQRPSVAGPFSLRVPAVAAGAAPDSGERHGLARPERETLRYSHNAFCCLTSLRFNRTSHLTAARYVCFWHVPCGHAGPMRQPGLADGSRLEFPQ